jgi:hypothetical protein
MLHQNFTADENLVPGLYKLIETEERDVKIQITYKERLTIEKNILPIEGVEDKVCTNIDG